MRGSIRKRGEKYSIVYELGREWDEDKKQWKRNQKWEVVPHPNNKKHAEKLLAKRLTEIDGGQFIEPTKITFAEYQDLWMKKYAIGEGQIRPSTLNLYTGHFKNH